MSTENAPPANHYVDNEKFQAAMLERRIAVDKAKELGLEKPLVSEYIGECIYEIARHLAFKSNFIGYSYRDEMIGDGIENCLRYIDNYDAYKYFKPFAYFTQINFYAFIRRIGREKKQAAVKAKLIREIPFEAFHLQEHDENGEFTNAFIEFLQQNDSADTTAFDTPKKKGRKKKLVEPDLSDFVDEVIPELPDVIDAEFEGVPIPEEILDDLEDNADE